METDIYIAGGLTRKTAPVVQVLGLWSESQIAVGRLPGDLGASKLLYVHLQLPRHHTMRALVSLALLFAPLGAAAESWHSPMHSEVQTRLGALEVVKDKTGLSYYVDLNGQKVVGPDPDSYDAFLSNPIRVGDRELVVISQESGGIACPTTYVVLEISAHSRVSERFGNCNPAYKLTVVGNKLQIAMPRYFAHPDDLTASERRRIKGTIDTYLWINGTIAEHKGKG